MNAIKKSLAVATLVAAAPLAQAVELSGNVAMATDYSFRGVTQTDERFALQGGFDAGFESGFYLGTWASNVDFGDDAQTELDLYAGFAFDVSESVSMDIGVIKFFYPGNEGDYNYEEYAVSLGISDLSLGVNYSPEFGNGGPSFYYFAADYSFGLPSDFGLDLHIGFTDTEKDGTFEPGEDSYTDWSITLTKSLAGVDVALAYVDTTIDDLFGSGSDEGADGRLVFSVSKSL